LIEGAGCNEERRLVGGPDASSNFIEQLSQLFYLSGPILAAYVNAEARSVDSDARAVPMVVIIVPVTVVHVQAIAAVEALASTEALVASLAANAVRVGGRCQ
jgi:hypothetical protein